MIERWTLHYVQNLNEIDYSDIDNAIRSGIFFNDPWACSFRVQRFTSLPKEFFTIIFSCYKWPFRGRYDNLVNAVWNRIFANF